MRQVSLFLLMISALTHAIGQEVNLQGSVYDAQSGEPLPGANIFLKDKSVGTASQPDGSFFASFDNVSFQDSVSISFIGYQTYKNSLPFFMEQSREIRLNPQTQLLNEVTVKSRQERFNVNAFMSQTLRKYKQEFRKTPHIAQTHYRETALFNGKYVQYTESIGYSIYLGEVQPGIAPLANYTFLYENTRRSDRASGWNPTHSKGDMNGQSNLNSFLRFKLRGPLSKSMSYHLDSIYLRENQLIHSISYSGKGEKGVFYVSEEKQIQRIQATETELYFSGPYNQLTQAKFDIRFQYYNNQPYLSAVNSYYQKDGLEHWNDLTILLQKLDEFVIANGQLQLSINSNSSQATSIYNEPDWRKYQIPAHGDFDQIERDLGQNQTPLEEQFRKNSILSAEDATGASEIIKELKKLF